MALGPITTLDIQAVIPPEVNGVWMVWFFGVQIPNLSLWMSRATYTCTVIPARVAMNQRITYIYIYTFYGTNDVLFTHLDPKETLRIN